MGVSGWDRGRWQHTQSICLGRANSRRCSPQPNRWGAEAGQVGGKRLAGLAGFLSGQVGHFMGSVREAQEYLGWVLAWLTPETLERLLPATAMDVLVVGLS
jgi:hypothetical protein